MSALGKRRSAVLSSAIVCCLFTLLCTDLR